MDPQLLLLMELVILSGLLYYDEALDTVSTVTYSLRDCLIRLLANLVITNLQTIQGSSIGSRINVLAQKMGYLNT